MGKGILQIVFLLALIGGLLAVRYAPLPSDSNTGKKQEEEIIMYSMKDCPACAVKRLEFRKAGIPFAEYFMEDIEVALDLGQKLRASGIMDQRVQTPVFDINGRIVMDNPPLERLLEIRAETRE